MISVPQLQALVKNGGRDLIQACTDARALAASEKKRVAAYVDPIWATYRGKFFVAPEKQKEGRNDEVIETPDMLYLADLESPLMAAYYEECFDAHAAHGWTGPRGHDPFLVADHAKIKAENALVAHFAPPLGIDPSSMSMEVYWEFIDLTLGLARVHDAEQARISKLAGMLA